MALREIKFIKIILGVLKTALDYSELHHRTSDHMYQKYR